MALQFLSPLHKASRQLSGVIGSHSDDASSSPAEGHLLTYLRSYGPVSIRALVRVFGWKASTFTSILDRLERPGLVRREMNPRDRRSFLIQLTESGRARADLMVTQLIELEDEIRAHVSVADIHGFHAVMAAIATVAEAREARKPMKRGRH